MHCLQDPQVQISTNFSLKLSPMALFTHLKIILLLCFQFSTISGIQTNPIWVILKASPRVAGARRHDEYLTILEAFEAEIL